MGQHEHRISVQLLLAVVLEAEFTALYAGDEMFDFDNMGADERRIHCTAILMSSACDRLERWSRMAA